MICQRILVVEDDPDIRSLVQEVLECQGYEVFAAENGEQALSLLRNMGNNPCLILLDMMMPVMNGWEFLEARKRDDGLAKIPVVVTSAQEADLGARQVSAFMRKPIDMDMLLNLVARYCLLTGYREMRKMG